MLVAAVRFLAKRFARLWEYLSAEPPAIASGRNFRSRQCRESGLRAFEGDVYGRSVLEVVVYRKCHVSDERNKHLQREFVCGLGLAGVPEKAGLPWKLFWALGRGNVLLPTQLAMELVMQLPALQSLANETLQLVGGSSLANIE